MATAEGSLRGQILGDVVSFKGVPFAAPPVGALRWREPAPVRPWAGVRNALTFGLPCAQAALDWNNAVAAQSREDCLTLNVWAPVRHNGAALPVMVFFPGGASIGEDGNIRNSRNITTITNYAITDGIEIISCC